MFVLIAAKCPLSHGQRAWTDGRIVRSDADPFLIPDKVRSGIGQVEYKDVM